MPQKSNHDFKEKYSNIRVDVLASMGIKNIFTDQEYLLFLFWDSFVADKWLHSLNDVNKELVILTIDKV